MVSSILGRFMVTSGRMSEEQFEQVLKSQETVRVKMGLIAVSEGMMTTEQADEVNRLQAVMDKRFGDIAIEKGFLTSAQVGNLLKLQGNEYLSFVQSIVDAGLLDMEGVETAVKEFQKANHFTNSEIEALKSGNTDDIVAAFLPPEALKYQEIIGVAVRTILRCIDRNVYIGEAEVAACMDVNGMVSQRMEGKNGLQSSFAEAQGGLLALASIFAQEEMPKLNEDALDAAGEMLNCINGLYVSAKSREGISLELMPPLFEPEETAVHGEDVCRIPVYVKNRKLYFIVSDQGEF